MMETILKKRERHPDEVLTEDSILRRTTEVARPIFFSTLIIITAYMHGFNRLGGNSLAETVVAGMC